MSFLLDFSNTYMNQILQFYPHLYYEGSNRGICSYVIHLSFHLICLCL